MLKLSRTRAHSRVEARLYAYTIPANLFPCPLPHSRRRPSRLPRRLTPRGPRARRRSCRALARQVEEFEGNLLKLKGEWSCKNEGPRSKKIGKEDGKNFKPEKTWNRNPQYRVWLRDPDTEATVESVGLAITLSTPIEEAEIGLHVMRNAFCQFYNEKIEVLADRYQKVAGVCPHTLANEMTFDITLDESFEVKKNGCETNFPFFIVPSLMDKKMEGPCVIGSPTQRRPT